MCTNHYIVCTHWSYSHNHSIFNRRKNQIHRVCFLGLFLLFIAVGAFFVFSFLNNGACQCKACLYPAVKYITFDLNEKKVSPCLQQNDFLFFLPYQYKQKPPKCLEVKKLVKNMLSKMVGSEVNCIHFVVHGLPHAEKSLSVSKLMQSRGPSTSLPSH